MITRKFTVNLVSFFGFDGISSLWEDFPYLSIGRDEESGSYRPARLAGSVYHYGGYGSYHGSYSGPTRETPCLPGFLKEEVVVTSDFVLTHEATIEYNGKIYRGTINFGLDQSVLALHIWDVGVKGKFLVNAVKLYTTVPTTKKFLRDEQPLFQE